MMMMMMWMSLRMNSKYTVIGMEWNRMGTVLYCNLIRIELIGPYMHMMIRNIAIIRLQFQRNNGIKVDGWIDSLIHIPLIDSITVVSVNIRSTCRLIIKQ